MRSGLARELTPERFARAFRRVGVADVDPERLRSCVLSGRYVPGQPHRRARRKSDGSTRWLIIPPPSDRAVQAAVLDVVGPRFDALLDDRVYGFRPGRSCADAVERLVSETGTRGWIEIVQIDVQGMFDNLDHRSLLGWAREAWRDPLWCRLTEAWTHAWAPAPGRGVPQGAPLSPLLSNIYLDHGFDRRWRATSPKVGGVAWIRYADDITVVIDRRGGGDAALSALEGVLGKAGLRIAPRKVARLVPGHGQVRILGYDVRIVRSGSGYALSSNVGAPSEGRGKVDPERAASAEHGVRWLGSRFLDMLGFLGR